MSTVRRVEWASPALIAQHPTLRWTGPWIIAVREPHPAPGIVGAFVGFHGPYATHAIATSALADDIAPIEREECGRFLGIAPEEVTAADLGRYYDWCDDADESVQRTRAAVRR